MQITDTQLIFLDNLIYLNLYDFDSNTVKETIDLILEKSEKYIVDGTAAMTTEQWRTLLTSFRDNPANAEFLENYVARNFVTGDTDEDGFRASCFVNVNDTTDVIAVFRGTYAGAEWEDNILVANDVWSEQMDKATLYIDNLPDSYGNNITVTGHSKGGNRAQYVTITTDRIGRCLSFDGQGFSQEFIDLYKDKIEERKSKITSISAQYDYVNALLTPIAGTIKYIQSVPDSNFAFNHCPNKVFDENANLNAEVEEPFIVSTLISILTQKPISEMSDPMADAVLELVAGKIAVPLFDLNDKTNVQLSIADAPTLVYLVQCIIESYNLDLIVPNKLFMVMSLSHRLTEMGYKVFDKLQVSGGQQMFLFHAKEIVSLYNEANEYEKNNQLIDGIEPMTAYEEKIKDMFLYGIDVSYDTDEIKDDLRSAYNIFLEYYTPLLEEPLFYVGLTDYQLGLIDNLVDIIAEEQEKNKGQYELNLERWGKMVDSFNGAESLYINYDPIVIDMGKTDFELTSIENGVNFDMDVNNTPFIFHRI